MVNIFLATSFLFVLFQTNCHATTARSTNKTTRQLLDESFRKLEYRYQILKDDMKKLHGTCIPCKASAKYNGVCDCTDIEPRKDIVWSSINMVARSMVCTVFKDLVSTDFMHSATKPLKVEDGQSSKGDKTVQWTSIEIGTTTNTDSETLKVNSGLEMTTSTI